MREFNLNAITETCIQILDRQQAVFSWDLEEICERLFDILGKGCLIYDFHNFPIGRIRSATMYHRPQDNEKFSIIKSSNNKTYYMSENVPWYFDSLNSCVYKATDAALVILLF